MRNKIYEADKNGRIYIYPSLDDPERKKLGILKVFIKKLIDVVRDKEKKSLREE